MPLQCQTVVVTPCVPSAARQITKSAPRAPNASVVGRPSSKGSDYPPVFCLNSCPYHEAKRPLIRHK